MEKNLFGRLQIIKEVGRDKYRRKVYSCRCLCGKIIDVDSHKLNSGNTKSCGCLRSDTSRILVKKVQHLAAMAASVSNKRHGMRGTRFYRIWQGMKQRCRDENNPNYGGLGVALCKEWELFEKFMDDMYKDYEEHCKDFGETRRGTSIDRINPFGNYEKSNCKWSTSREQRLNQRKSYLK